MPTQDLCSTLGKSITTQGSFVAAHRCHFSSHLTSTALGPRPVNQRQHCVKYGAGSQLSVSFSVNVPFRWHSGWHQGSPLTTGWCYVSTELLFTTKTCVISEQKQFPIVANSLFISRIQSERHRHHQAWRRNKTSIDTKTLCAIHKGCSGKKRRELKSSHPQCEYFNDDEKQRTETETPPDDSITRPI